jgi:hypothetical protein
MVVVGGWWWQQLRITAGWLPLIGGSIERLTGIKSRSTFLPRSLEQKQSHAGNKPSDLQLPIRWIGTQRVLPGSMAPEHLE